MTNTAQTNFPCQPLPSPLFKEWLKYTGALLIQETGIVQTTVVRVMVTKPWTTQDSVSIFYILGAVLTKHWK
jgi:hypothetical protein